MSCSIPANQPIYQALLNKAASYPADQWRASAYRGAAETVRKYNANIYDEFAEYNGFAGYKPMAIGKSTEQFIREFINSQKSVPPTPVEVSSKCAIPANEPIYKVLLEKAADAEASGLTWKARAWRTSAEKMSAVDIDLVANYGTQEYYKVLDKFGPKAWELIDDYCCAAPSLQAAADVEKRRTQMMSEEGADCFVPGNNGLYNALLYRAFKASNKYSAKRYTDAATKVLASHRNISYAWSAGQGEEAIENLGVCSSIAAYIKYYCNEIKGGKVFKYPSTDDEKAEEALKVYCIKNNYTYSDEILKEYKKWLPTATKWDLEKFEYDANEYVSRSVAELASQWAENYSKTLLPQHLANKYVKALMNYCKWNNIVYQPKMLEKLNAWREANKEKTLKKVSHHWAEASKQAGCAVGTYPLEPHAVIGRWFATLPKTVTL
jgi:DNA polymerase/3'-5' exonuclease PolX